MSAPEHAGLVLRFDARTAPAPGPRGDRELEVQLMRKSMQLDAVLDRVTAQELFMWVGRHDTPLTDVQIEARRQEIRAEWVGVALDATNRRHNTKRD